MIQIDINCDVGESFGRYSLGDQEALFTYITSANIACGFHAGDPHIMRETVELAVQHGVKIGAHPGLPDLLGFGRREMKITAQEAYDLVVYQIGALQGVLTPFKQKLHHVKPHGALYNMAATDENLADAIARAVRDVDPTLILYGLAGSKLAIAGEKIGLQTAHEVFADRTYEQDGTLTSRQKKDALISSDTEAIQQAVQMVEHKTVTTRDGKEIPLQADTLCLHGDGAHAVSFAEQITKAFTEKGIRIKEVEKK